jgi:hypothetical protein
MQFHALNIKDQPRLHTDSTDRQHSKDAAMPADLVDSLGRNIDALAYVFLVVVLVITTITADRRYTAERHRNVQLERRIRSLVLVVQFQDALISNHEQAVLPAPQVVDPEDLFGLPVDAMISKMGYCLTCNRLKAPSHFTQTDHLRLEDEHIIPESSPERH